jgi:hypothetical protein
MNIRNLRARIVSSILALGIVVSLVGLGANSSLAQSITVTTPFSFCVNNQAYPKGRYEFTHISQWVLSIRNVNERDKSFFLIHPDDRVARGSTSDPVGSVSGLTFRTSQGFQELQAVHGPGFDFSVQLAGQMTPRDKSKNRGTPKPMNCFTERSSTRGRNKTGQ